MWYPTLLYSGLLVVAFSCTEKSKVSENKMKARFITEQLFDNAKISAIIADEASKSRKPQVLSAFQRSEQLVLWRKKYLKDQTVSSLIWYSDSILNRYASLLQKDQ